VKSENLGPAINTQNHEYLPCLSVDGQTLIFTRVVNGNEDFYKSTKDKDGNWVTAQAITELNTNSNEGAQSISADGKTIVFTACDYKDSNGSCDLYISYLVGTNWSPPKNMGPVVNSISWDSQPSLSANGNQLFFASNRLGGFGGSDIWVSEKSITGVWQMPKPMPSPINDAYKSESPFIHPDGKTLYFRSDRKPGFGGFDLFMSRLSPEGIWSTPINLGSPINSSNDEGALIISLDGEFAYYASDKLDKSGSEIGYVNYGKNDIYRFKMPEQLKPGLVTYVKGKVIDQNTKNGLLAKIEIKTLGNNTSLVEMKTDLDGSFLFCIPAGASYALNVSKEGYAFNSQNFTLDLQKKAEPFYLEIPLQRLLSGDLKSNKPIVLNNIFFDTGASNLRADSDFELDKLYELLNNNKQLKIQINGHTDDIGNESDNLKLSENRAKSVYEYLIKKGISSDRLNYKGFGESMPLVENKDAESRQINRRTEFEIK
jgi:outer membrane protein OmpA-like peptidoglycan-associated protein/Tol biopolymer transport system component